MLLRARADFCLLASEAWTRVRRRCPLAGETTFQQAAWRLAELREVPRVLRREERELNARLTDEGLVRLPYEALDRADRRLGELGAT